MTFGCSGSLKNFLELLSVSWEVFVLHAYDWIHWVAKSCTTTAHRWLFRDSQSSLRTLWSAVFNSPNFSARGGASPVRFLQRELVISVLMQMSQFRSFGKRVWILCFLCATFIGRAGSESWEILCGCWLCVFEIFCELLQPIWEISDIRCLTVVVVFGFCWIALISGWLSVGIVTSLYCWTWRDTTRRVLRWRCRGRTCARAWGNCWQSWDNRHEVFRVAHTYFPILGQLWFLTIGPLVGTTVFFAELA